MVNIKNTIENHPVVIFGSVLITGFIAGFSVYHTILNISGKNLSTNAIDPKEVIRISKLEEPLRADTPEKTLDKMKSFLGKVILVSEIPNSLRADTPEKTLEKMRSFLRKVILIGELEDSLRADTPEKTLDKMKGFLGKVILVSEIPKTLRADTPEKALDNIKEATKISTTTARISYLENQIPKYDESINFLFDREDKNKKKSSSRLQKIFSNIGILKSVPNDNMFCTASLLYVYSDNDDALKSNLDHLEIQGLGRSLDIAYFKRNTLKAISLDYFLPREKPLKIKCEVNPYEKTLGDKINTCQCDKT